MKRLFFYVFFCFITLSSSKAQDREFEVVDGMTWYLTKKDAIEVAREQGKYIFLMWGNSSCHRCDELKKDAGWCFLQPIIDKYYILWYSDGEKYKRDSPEVSDYLSSFPKGSIPQPVLCVIYPTDTTKAYGHRSGIYDIDDLSDMLEKSVSNEFIQDLGKVLVYVSGNNIIIHSDFGNETISIFSVTGSLIDQFDKKGYSFSRDLSTYPKGVLIVKGETGWVRKVAVR